MSVKINSIDFQRLATLLGGTQKTQDNFLCRCPLHQEDNQFLHLKRKSNGDLILDCLLKCPTQEILKSLPTLNKEDS